MSELKTKKEETAENMNNWFSVTVLTLLQEHRAGIEYYFLLRIISVAELGLRQPLARHCDNIIINTSVVTCAHVCSIEFIL